MATVPSPAAYAAGEKVLAAKLTTSGQTNINFLLNPPTAQVSLQTPVSPASGATTVFIFDTEEIDTDTMYGSGAHVNIVTPGIYEIIGSVGFSANSVGARQALVRLNGTNIMSSTRQGPSTTGTWSGTTSVYQRCVAGDFVELLGIHVAGVAIATATGDQAPRLTVRWVSK